MPFIRERAYYAALVGVVAQLVERLVRNEKVRGSTPLGSTSLPSQRQPKTAAPAPSSPNYPRALAIMLAGAAIAAFGFQKVRRPPEHDTRPELKTA